MRILLCGYGRMGKEIEAVALRREHTIVARIDPKSPGADFPGLETFADATAGAGGLRPENAGEAAIDFALPGGILERIQFYLTNKIPAVIGTTGWDDEREAARKMVEEASGSVIWSSNFSIGAQLLFRISAFAAQLADPFDDYDVSIHETHHRQKVDSPSGTALSLAERVLASIQRKQKVFTEAAHRKIEPGELHVTSTRCGSNPGEHHIVFDSRADSIELVHRARNRSGFAGGAVVAAEWIAGKTGFFSIDDLFDDLTRGGV